MNMISPAGSAVTTSTTTSTSATGQRSGGEAAIPTPPKRSCEQCNRKKSKCDRKWPRCSRCEQGRSACVYPTRRKKPSPVTKCRTLLNKLMQSNDEIELDRLLDELDPEDLKKALRRRREVSEQKDQRDRNQPSDSGSTVDEKLIDVEASPLISSFPVSRSWQDTAMDFDCQTEDPSQDPNEPDLGFWTSLADWNDTDVTLPPFELGPLLPPMEDFAPSNKSSIRSYNLQVPVQLVDELIELFFDRVQCFVPIFHRPRFLRRYQDQSLKSNGYSNLTREDAFILYGVMAMAARFSTSPFFDNAPPAAKGQLFAVKALGLYEESFTYEIRSQTSLPLLQGCILLSFYEQTARPSTKSWFLIGACIRLALELGLHNMDATPDVAQCPSPQWSTACDWTFLEEKRRAWWLVWELDVFASTILRRPQCIDKNHMTVLLPSSDAKWFADTPVESTITNSNPTQIWQTLRDCPEIGARSWFLVATFMMAKAHDYVLHKDATLQDIASFEATIGCFMLLLPPEFHLSTSAFPFDATNFSSYNWVVSILLMLHTVRVLLHKAKGSRQRAAQKDRSIDAIPATESPLQLYDDTQLVFRVMRSWAPEFMVYACPFVSCTIVGPSLDNIRTAMVLDKTTHGLHTQVIKLILKRIGTYWEIGNSASKLVEIFENDPDGILGQNEQDLPGLQKSFSLLVGDSTLQGLTPP